MIEYCNITFQDGLESISSGLIDGYMRKAAQLSIGLKLIVLKLKCRFVIDSISFSSSNWDPTDDIIASTNHRRIVTNSPATIHHHIWKNGNETGRIKDSMWWYPPPNCSMNVNFSGRVCFFLLRINQPMFLFAPTALGIVSGGID